MKTGKKVMILLLVFVAAAVVYFVHPVGKKEEHGVTEYTAMEKAKFPVLYATMGEREMAPVFGQTEERGVTAGRDSLILLPIRRNVPIAAISPVQFIKIPFCESLFYYGQRRTTEQLLSNVHSFPL